MNEFLKDESYYRQLDEEFGIRPDFMEALRSGDVEGAQMIAEVSEVTGNDRQSVRERFMIAVVTGSGADIEIFQERFATLDREDHQHFAELVDHLYHTHPSERIRERVYLLVHAAEAA